MNAIRYCAGCGYVAREPRESENGDVLCPKCPRDWGLPVPLVPLGEGPLNYLVTSRIPSPGPHASASGALGLLLALGLLEYRRATHEHPPRPHTKPVLDYTARGAAVVYGAIQLDATARRLVVVDLTDRACESLPCTKPATHLDANLEPRCDTCDPPREIAP